jgi:hypothetical protein
MGNSFKKFKLKRMTNDTLLGSDTHCPIWNDLFSQDTSYGVFNAHIDMWQLRGQLFMGAPATTIPVKIPSVTTSSKLIDLRSKIKANKISFTEGANLLTVRRDNVIEDSRETFWSFNNRKELKILFEGENKSAASDAGGMSKEWFTCVTQELLKPENKLFRKCDADEISYFISEENEEEKDKDDKFFFVGLFMAKALFDKIPINLCLSKAIYKYILSDDGMELEELKEFDRPLYHSLKYINDNNIEDGSCAEIYFTHLRKDGTEEELTMGGKEIQVTESNKYQFIWVKIDFVTKEIVESQLESLKKGFLSLIQKNWIKGMTCEELEKAICGENDISLSEWEACTVYKGAYNRDHEVIRWFWDVLGNYPQEDLSKILQFWTGTPRLPVGGFSALEGNRGNESPFTIEFMVFSPTSPFPRAHTCFNRLQLPRYKSYKDLKKNLDYVIQHDQIYGFGLED